MTRLKAIALIFPAALAMSAAGCAGGVKGADRTPGPNPAADSSPPDALSDASDAETPDDAGTGGHPDAVSDAIKPDGSACAGTPCVEILTGTVLYGPEPKLQTLFPGCKSYKEIPVPKKGPYKDVRLVTSTWPSPAPGDQLNTSYHLAIRTSDGWFIMRYLGTSGVNCGGESLFSTSFVLKTLEMRDILPGDPPEVLLTYDESVDGTHDEKLLVCGIGPSTKPSCMGPMTPARNDAEGAYKSWKSEVIFKPDGSLEWQSGQETIKTFTLSFP